MKTLLAARFMPVEAAVVATINLNFLSLKSLYSLILSSLDRSALKNSLFIPIAVMLLQIDCPASLDPTNAK